MVTRRVLIRLAVIALLLQSASGIAWAQVDSGGRRDAAADRLRNAGPEERRRFRQEMRDRYNNAGPEERRRMEQRLEQMRRGMGAGGMQGDGLTRERLRRYRREINAAPDGAIDRRPLPAEQRRELGRRLREMSPDERAQLRRQLRRAGRAAVTTRLDAGAACRRAGPRAQQRPALGVDERG